MNLIRALHVVLFLAAVADAAPPTEAEKERERVRVAIEIARARAPVIVPPKSDPGDPLRIDDYAAFVARIRTGQRGVLVVGIPDKWAQSYQLHCHVESGFGGLADGDWDAWLDSRTNTPVLQPRKAAKTPEVVRPPIPFSDSTGITIAPAKSGTEASTSGVVMSSPPRTSSTATVTRTGRVLYAGPSGPIQTQCVGFS